MIPARPYSERLSALVSISAPSAGHTIKERNTTMADKPAVPIKVWPSEIQKVPVKVPGQSPPLHRAGEEEVTPPGVEAASKIRYAAAESRASLRRTD